MTMAAMATGTREPVLTSEKACGSQLCMEQSHNREWHTLQDSRESLSLVRSRIAACMTLPVEHRGFAINPESFAPCHLPLSTSVNPFNPVSDEIAAQACGTAAADHRNPVHSQGSGATLSVVSETE